MKLVLLLSVFLSSLALSAQHKAFNAIPLKGKSISAFIPSGYDTLMTYAGDLDKDNKDDLAMVLYPKIEDTLDFVLDEIDSIPPHILVVLLKRADGYILAGKNNKSILCKYCGGIYGDPFSSIQIKKGVLTITHYGGSAWRWSFNHKFRYQKNDLYLIGQTSLSYWNISDCPDLAEMAATEFLDENLVTGEFEEKKVSEEGCVLLVDRKGKAKVKPLIKLSAFKFQN